MEVNVFFSPRYMKRWKEEGVKGLILAPLLWPSVGVKPNTWKN